MPLKLNQLVIGKKYRITRVTRGELYSASTADGVARNEAVGMVVTILDIPREIDPRWTLRMEFSPKDADKLRKCGVSINPNNIKGFYPPELEEVIEDPREAIELAWFDYTDQVEYLASGRPIKEIEDDLRDAFEAGYRAAVEGGASCRNTK